MLERGGGEAEKGEIERRTGMTPLALAEGLDAICWAEGERKREAREGGWGYAWRACTQTSPQTLGKMQRAESVHELALQHIRDMQGAPGAGWCHACQLRQRVPVPLLAPAPHRQMGHCSSSPSVVPATSWYACAR